MEWPPSYTANCNLQVCNLRNICKHRLLDIWNASEANIPFAWSVFYFCFFFVPPSRHLLQGRGHLEPVSIFVIGKLASEELFVDWHHDLYT